MAKAPTPTKSAPARYEDDDDDNARVEGQASQPAPAPMVRTAADEQRERADEVQKVGVEKWKADHDERDPNEKPAQVKGVSPSAGITKGEPGALK